MTYPRTLGRPASPANRRLRIVFFIVSEIVLVSYCLYFLHPVIRDLSETSGFPLIYRMAEGENLPGYAEGTGLVTAREELPYDTESYYSFLCAFTIEPQEPHLNNGKPLIIRDTCFASDTGEQREFIYPVQDPNQAAFAREDWERHSDLLLRLLGYAGIMLIFSLWFTIEALTGFPHIGRTR